MSNINLTCDVCGRQVQGYTWVNGMRFCAKCYQETFGASKDWQLLDKDKTITEQRKQIADLEAKLAESEKQVKHWHDLYNDRDNQFQSVRQRYHLLNKLQSNYDKKDKLHLAYMQCLELVDENEQLKQQLAEWQDGTIICKWTDAENRVKELEQQLAEKEKEIDKMNKAWVQSVHDWKVLCKNKDQDKISFAVEQLEKVKSRYPRRTITWSSDDTEDGFEYVSDYIDKQIKKLKEKKDV